MKNNYGFLLCWESFGRWERGREAPPQCPKRAEVIVREARDFFRPENQNQGGLSNSNFEKS